MSTPVGEILDRLEQHYGPQHATWPVDPYDFLIWWHCGYPASEVNCAKGWDSLKKIGTEPKKLLDASTPKLAAAIKPGGMMPELRAMRLKEIAARVQDQYAGDLRNALRGPLPAVRKALKSFPGIADPGADRIVLFGGMAPLAAIPSNGTHVLARILRSKPRENFGANYKDAQTAIEAGVPETFDSRMRAYLLIRTHGQELCKRTNPKCSICPIRDRCKYAKATSS